MLSLKDKERIVWCILHAPRFRFTSSGALNWSALRRELKHDKIRCQKAWEEYMALKGLKEVPPVAPLPDKEYNLDLSVDVIEQVKPEEIVQADNTLEENVHADDAPSELVSAQEDPHPHVEEDAVDTEVDLSTQIAAVQRQLEELREQSDRAISGLLDQVTKLRTLAEGRESKRARTNGFRHTS
jgi:hypothetical protein